MKTARRQELRTNELAQQIDQVRVYVRQNMTVITTVVVAAAVVAGAVFWYVRHRESRLMDGWFRLGQRAALTDQGSPIDQLKSVAQEGIDPQLTIQAWLKIGETALGQIMRPPKVDAAPATPAQDWPQVAEEAFNKVISSGTASAPALGQAMIALGVLAENRGDAAKAREWYEKASKDDRFAQLPIREQASYRLAGLDRWSRPVEFAPPPPPPPMPDASTQPALVVTTRPVDAVLSPASAPAGEIPALPAPPAATPPATPSPAAPK
jgi:hypothetical protein